MMNAGFAGFMPVVDTYGPAAASKGSSAPASGDTGFSDTLSSVARKDSAQSQQDEAQPQATAPAPHSSSQEETSAAPGEANGQADDAVAGQGNDAIKTEGEQPPEAAGKDAEKVSSKDADEKPKDNHGKIVAEVANQSDAGKTDKEQVTGKTDAKAEPVEETKGDKDADLAGADDAPKSSDSDVTSLLALLSSSASSTAIAAAAQEQPVGKTVASANAGKQKGDDTRSAVEDVVADLKSDAGALGMRQSDKAGSTETDHVVPGLSDSAAKQQASTSDGPGLAGLSTAKGARSGSEKSATGSADPTMSVEVLDSRRFLGFTQNTNSSNVLKTVTGDQSWASAMQTASADMQTESGAAASKVVNTLKIQMHPIDLGSVTATLKLVGEQLVVDLKVENSHAYRQLKDDQQNMVNALRSQGYAVDQISVSMAPTPDKSGTSTGQNTAQGQGFAQQQAGQGSAGGSGQGGGNSRNSTGEDQRYAAQESVTTPSSSSQQGRGSGQVYL
jgi:chemotaxis protein MotD